MKKNYVLVILVLLAFLAGCETEKRTIKIYSSQIAGQAVLINVDLEEMDSKTESFDDKDAPRSLTYDFFGENLTLSYKRSYKNRLYATDYYEYHNDLNNYTIGIEKSTGKIRFLMFGHNRDVDYTEEELSNQKTEQECKDYAYGYLKQLTELYDLYEIKDSIKDDAKAMPEYSYIYTLNNNGLVCDEILIIVRGDGKLSAYSQGCSILREQYDLAGEADVDKAYRLAEKALKDKFKDDYDKYIFVINYAARLDISQNGINILLSYKAAPIGCDIDDQYQIVDVLIPIEMVTPV